MAADKRMFTLIVDNLAVGRWPDHVLRSVALALAATGASLSRTSLCPSSMRPLKCIQGLGATIPVAGFRSAQTYRLTSELHCPPRINCKSTFDRPLPKTSTQDPEDDGIQKNGADCDRHQIVTPKRGYDLTF